MSPTLLPETGWKVFRHDPDLAAWLDHVRPFANAAAADPAHAKWLRHGGTWFAGVDVLNNDQAGRVADGPQLDCAALRAAGPMPLHKGQVSVTYPGYPRQDEGESDGAHRYRRSRDAAHLDGLKPIGPDRRRMLKEPHAWILGLPLSPMRKGQAPLVVWERSQEFLRAALSPALTSRPEKWRADTDLTDIYQAARRRIFETCDRVEIEAEPGQAILLHRMILHGVAPWDGPEGPPRAVIYFRPVLERISDWLAMP